MGHWQQKQQKYANYHHVVIGENLNFKIMISLAVDEYDTSS